MCVRKAFNNNLMKKTVLEMFEELLVMADQAIERLTLLENELLLNNEDQRPNQTADLSEPHTEGSPQSNRLL